jgi:hypothetical protein
MPSKEEKDKRSAVKNLFGQESILGKVADVSLRST